MIEAVPGFDPGHLFYDPLGNPITVEDWGARMEQDRTLREDTVDGIIVRTIYLGLVDPRIHDARLFGTVLTTAMSNKLKQVQVYDSEVDATMGHFAHVEAVGKGFHCHRCEIGEPHD